MIIEVDSNPNCDLSVFARFKEAGPARRVVQVKTYERSAEGEWCWITGWSDDVAQPACPAYAQCVEDSGAGVAYVVFGGIYGVRLKPVTSEEAWSLSGSDQWGEPYLSLASPGELVFADSDPGSP